LGIWIKQIINGEEMNIFGDGNQLRDFNYVEDTVDAFLLTAVSEEAYGQIFNLGSSESTNLNDLAKLLIKINKSGLCTHVPFPPDRKQIDIGDYYGNFNKIRSMLGWEPETTLLDYYRKYGKHYWDN
jgi:nucleoside-diphosphate-sugar epimerase